MSLPTAQVTAPPPEGGASQYTLAGGRPALTLYQQTTVTH